MMRMLLSMLRVLPVAIVLVASPFGCKKETPTSPKPAERQQAQKVEKGPQEAASAAEQEQTKVETETYLYDPKGRRDPFLSIIEASKKDREAEKKKKGVRSLEAYEVNEIKIIAIAWDKKRYFAMVQFPDNKYYTIKEGMTLGPYGGKVIKIDEEKVVVREYVKNYRGEMQSKDTILQLRKEEGQ